MIVLDIDRRRLDYLDARELLILRETSNDERFLVDGQSYIEVNGVRFVGIVALASHLLLLIFVYCTISRSICYSVLPAHPHFV